MLLSSQQGGCRPTPHINQQIDSGYPPSSLPRPPSSLFTSPTVQSGSEGAPPPPLVGQSMFAAEVAFCSGGACLKGLSRLFRLFSEWVCRPCPAVTMFVVLWGLYLMGTVVPVARPVWFIIVWMTVLAPGWWTVVGGGMWGVVYSPTLAVGVSKGKATSIPSSFT